MIGVIANPADERVVCEFFELFKTPWEFYRKGPRYDVLICAGSGEFDEAAKIILVYAGRNTQFDDQHQIQTGNQRRQACILRRPAGRIPIYGDSITLAETGTSLLVDVESRECVAYLDRSAERALVRIGYDLFEEVRTLLSLGQPPANAEMPALELHIALLRDLITGCGVTLAEIPPVPEGYRFIACLTHDVDHPSSRQHKWDHTTFGFLYRAVFGSLFDLFRGRMSFRNLATNWEAALKLPLVHLGLVKDLWREFGDRYLEIEKGVRSTFFVIPFRDRPGKKWDGPAPAFRAARYGARDIADTILRLQAEGCEVALHGIDAWIDSSSGREELEEIRRLTGVSGIGVRMHWLYYDQQSPRTIENAGALYDSTMGYNGTVGYRAGTTQAYKPIEASRLLELPLHVMDTAMFYPAHLGLCQEQAKAIIGAIVENFVELGGCLTINWHDRSIAPERLWEASYRELVQDLKDRGAWFATAGEATAWFRKRRLAVFEMDCGELGGVRAMIAADCGDRLPGLRLRIHKAQESFRVGGLGSQGYVDMALDESLQVAC
jgi:peptidoglycan/xylan/chitin deacetylase (PgdA/CDA1 family)